MKCHVCDSEIDVVRHPGVVINRQATLRAAIQAMAEQAVSLSKSAAKDKKAEALLSKLLLDLEAFRTELAHLEKLQASRPAAQSEEPNESWTASKERAKCWEVTYWQPGSYVYDTYVADAIARKVMIAFTCKLCGKKHAAKFNRTRPSETALPETLTTDKNAKGEHFFKCSTCEG